MEVKCFLKYSQWRQTRNNFQINFAISDNRSVALYSHFGKDTFIVKMPVDSLSILFIPMAILVTRNISLKFTNTQHTQIEFELGWKNNGNIKLKRHFMDAIIHDWNCMQCSFTTIIQNPLKYVDALSSWVVHLLPVLVIHAIAWNWVHNELVSGMYGGIFLCFYQTTTEKTTYL